MDDIIERRRRENPKLKVASLKRKRDAPAVEESSDDAEDNDDELNETMDAIDLSEDDEEGAFSFSALSTGE